MQQIELRGKRGLGILVTVDYDDFSFLSQFPWTLGNNGYPVFRRYCGIREPGTNKWIYRRVPMHHMIMGKPLKGVIDHIDGNPFNNTRANLRICTQQQNVWNSRKMANNSSGFIGVSWCSQTGKWKAQLGGRSQSVNLGRYETKEEAAYVYDQFALALRGDYAVLNIL